MRSEAERLGDLHHLASGDGQPLHRSSRIDVSANHRQHLRGHLPSGPSVDKPGFGRLPPQHEVLFDSEHRHQGRLLIDDGDAGVDGIPRGSERNLLAVQVHRPGVRSMQTGHDLDQCRLARAVFPDQSVDLPCLELGVDVGQGMHAVELLRDLLYLEQAALTLPSRPSLNIATCADGGGPQPSAVISTHAWSIVD